MAQSSGELIALAVVFVTLAFVAVILRIWSRQLIKKANIRADDVLVFAAAIILLACLIIPTIILAARENLGNHIHRQPNGKPVAPTYLNNVLQRVLQVTSEIPIGLAKCSVLLFYKTIFCQRGTSPKLEALIWTTTALVLGWMIAFVFTNLFSCTPVTLSLHNPASPRLHCVDVVKVYYSAVALDVFMDMIIIIIPWRPIWKLHLPRRHKIAVGAIFLLAGLTTAASITRLVEFVHAGNLREHGDVDTTYFVTPTVYWVIIEGSLAIVCACLPTLRPLFRSFSPESIVRSVRSALSLHSIRSRTSNRSKKSQVSKNKSPKSPTSSIANLHAPSNDAVVVVVPEGGAAQNLEMNNFPRKETSREGIMVQKAWETTHSAL